MRIARLAATMLAVAAPTAAAGRDSDPASYDCTISRSGAFGLISVSAPVLADGRSDIYRINWSTALPGPGLRLDIVWLAAGLRGPPDENPVGIYLGLGRRRSGAVRLELRRGWYAALPSDLAFTSQLARPIGDPFASTRWGDLKFLMQGVDALEARLIDGHGDAVAQARLPAAWLAWPAAALEAVRAPLAEMQADFRRRCPPHVYSPGEDI